MDKKLTDSEIVKALECCVGDPYTCGQCSYQQIKHYDYDNDMFEIMPNGIQYDQWSCDRWLLIDLLDLINRQKAKIKELSNNFNTQGNVCENLLEENANLKAENEELFLENQKFLSVMLWGNKKDAKNLVNNIKAEAYKEFAERVKIETRYLFSADSIEVEVDNLLKELVGE